MANPNRGRKKENPGALAGATGANSKAHKLRGKEYHPAAEAVYITNEALGEFIASSLSTAAEVQRLKSGINDVLPAETLHEIRDCLVIALDATEDDEPGYWQTVEARNAMQSALGLVQELLGGGAVQ